VDLAFALIGGEGCSYVGTDGKEHTTFSRPYQPSEYPIRTRHQYPYSYSPIVIFGDENEKAHSQYSDRLYEQNYDLTDKLCQKHFGNKGQYFNNRDPEKIEAFLKERLGHPTLKLTMIVEWCNVSNGYPLWSFHFTVA
jgi:hypothetical protein